MIVDEISKNDFQNLLDLVSKKLLFQYQALIQVDVVAMGFPLLSIQATFYLSHHEENWLKECLVEFKPTF